MLKIIQGRRFEFLKSLSKSSVFANYSTKDKTPFRRIHPIDETYESYVPEDFVDDHPFNKTIFAFKRSFVIKKRQVEDLIKKEPYRFDEDDFGPYSVNTFPRRADVVIIGGGVMGSAIAYSIKERIPKGFSVVVVEKDPTYKNASTALSVGGLRQQFSCEENIQMSLYSADFLRKARQLLDVPGEPPIDVRFRPFGYLFLATEKSVPLLMENWKLQHSLGARNVLLSPEQIKAKFPWINTNGIAMGCLGIEKEGWFDPWSLLMGYKRKAITLGAEYIKAEAKGFVFENASPYFDKETGRSIHQKLDQIVVERANGEKRAIKFAILIVACGAFSARIARMAGVGVGPGIMSAPLPVEPRKRYIYCFHCPDGPGINTPLTIDPSGAYFRREGLGGLYICGQGPDPDEEPPIDNLNVDESFFYEKIWPNLANRVPAFAKLKLKSSWAGFYEYNYFDGNGIVGAHPVYRNLMFATGFSGHGIQQAPAVGRAVTELIVSGRYMTIDLTRMGFERFLTMEPMDEALIV